MVRSKGSLNLIWKDRNKSFIFVNNYNNLPLEILDDFKSFLKNNQDSYSKIGYNKRGTLMLLSKSPMKIFNLVELKNNRPKIVDTLWKEDLKENLIERLDKLLI